MALTGNTGYVSVSGVQECDIVSWELNIIKDTLSTTTMCTSGAPTFIQNQTRLEGSFTSYEWMGDISSAAIVLSNAALTISAGSAFFSNISISTTVGEVLEYVYDFSVSGTYSIVVK